MATRNHISIWQREPALGLAVIVILIVGPPLLSFWIGMTVLGLTKERGFWDTIFDFLLNDRPWPGIALTLVMGALWIAQLVIIGLITWSRMRKTRTHSTPHAAAVSMARRSELGPLAPDRARERAQRLIGDHATKDPNTWGPLLGIQEPDGVPIRSSWEDTALVIAGPRTQKTTSQVIPVVLSAPGPAFVTSNKRDVVDGLRGPCEQRGTVWVFDPQHRVGPERNFWWNPLAHLLRPGVDSVAEALKLAGHFSSANKDGGTRRDAYFDPAGETLLAYFFLAAACENRPITDVLAWLSDAGNREPASILFNHQFHRPATTVEGYISLDPRQRDGIFGTASQMAQCLTSEPVNAWVTPPSTPIAEFDPYHFATSRDTVFAISREGAGTAAPLVTALTAVTLEAAEQVAALAPSGRLGLPMSVVLDEAANVCKIRDLPDLYSHYGSRGITLRTILQSYQQGAVVWGKEGMEKLWSSSNIRIYGGGVADQEFLKMLSELIGERDEMHAGTNRDAFSIMGGSVNKSVRRLAVLDVAQLSALPAGKVIIIASQVPAVMATSQPWWETPWKAEVQRSIDTYQPQGIA